MSNLIESAVIGVLAGGWAEATYWQGDGWVVGIAAGFMAWFVLAVTRDIPEKKRRKGAFYRLDR